VTAGQPISDSTQLREVYHHPAQGALDKVVHQVDDGAAAFIAASPFFVLSTATLIEQPNIGMLFLVPGVVETLRVNGTARLVQDADILATCAIDDRTPKTAVVVEVQECYIHCGAALRRSDLWNTSTWLDRDDIPSPAAILAKHIRTEIPAEEIQSGLEHYYDNYIWFPGGREDDAATA
jgi:predicted pyridoxine 5'-phosphate oxidase superfamily flavin-nucleotide-binding protein